MKILFIWRGPSPYRVDFFNELGKLCDLTVLFERNPQNIKDKNKEWFHEDFSHFKGVYLKGINIGQNFRICFSVLNYIRLIRNADFVVVGMYSTPTQMFLILLLKFLGIKYILNSDGGFIKNDNFFERLIKHFFIGGAYAYLSSSAGTSCYLRHYGAKSTINIYPFTSAPRGSVSKKIDEIHKDLYKKELGICEKVMVMFSGQFIHRKGIDILLKAIPDIPAICSVYIIGGKPTSEYLSIVKKLNLKNVHFVDFKTPKQLESYYMAADIYVLPTREDIWGLVINEAMSFGLPVVTTDRCLAGTELIENGKNGYIVPINSVGQLSDAITKIALDDSLRKSMGDNNKAKISEYTLESMAQNHYDFFRKLQCS